MEENSPNSGNVSDVFGRFSDRESMKTEKERRMEIPREIFSPWSGGDRNVMSVSDDSMTHGRMRLSVKKRCLLVIAIVAATFENRMCGLPT